MMRDRGSNIDVISVTPQDEALNLDIKFYFSKVSSIRDDTLENPEYASNATQTLIVIQFFYDTFSLS
jgi:ABC-type transport system involved in Fe-S cluster assembly fused permease/ATPase subunit